MMRDNIRICMQHLTGHNGRFSDELEKFWRDVALQYRQCTASDQIPEAHIPLWYARIKDEGIPIAYGEPAKMQAIVEPEEKPKRFGPRREPVTA